MRNSLTYPVYLIVALVFFISCKDTSQSVANIEAQLYSQELAEDALNGITYADQYFNTIIDSLVTAVEFTNDNKQLQVVLKRGQVFEIESTQSELDNYFQAKLADGRIVHLSRETQYFQQELKGMRYPLYGVVDRDDAFVSIYDTVSAKTKQVSLKRGTVLLFVIMKDVPFVNVKHPETSEYITAAYCCNVNIIQAEDHYKLLSKYRTSAERILKYSFKNDN